MTLNITLLTPVAIYQSADFRLTDPADASLIRDESAKTVVLQYMSWAGFVTYTGIGSWEGENLSEIVADWLTGIPNPSMSEVAALIEREGTQLITVLERRNRTRFLHTFTLAGFEDGLARAFVISNFEDCLGRKRPTDSSLTTAMRELDTGSNALVIVTGCPKAVPNTEKRILRKLAVLNPLDGGLIRTRMQELNAQASRSPESTDLVSEDCAVISFRFDGFGILQRSQSTDAGPKHVPIILNGFNQHKMIVDAMANLGLDMSNAQMGNATFVSTHAPGPAGNLQSTCKFPIKDTESSGGYEILEITDPDFEPMFAYDINDAGNVVGTGRDEQKVPWTTQVPWIMQEYQVSRLNYAGSAWAINDDGLIVATPSSDPNQNAALYASGSIIPLPIIGPDAASVGGTRISGTAINCGGIVAGSVCTQSGHNMRAAAFHAAQPPKVLTNLDAPFGTRAVDINDHNQVLVLVNSSPGARSVLWDLENNAWSYVGGSTANVTPVAITNGGLVLGTTADGASRAVICEQDGEWQPLGTSNGWLPQALNDLGDVVGLVAQGGLFQPWLRTAAGEEFLLPYVMGHNTDPKAINIAGVIVGTSHADHGGHAVMWRRP
ncbi:hypothetical protein [Mycobacterium sp. E2479]|uniref:hypothetical protein n=1 Tax=Mycobacterium sp. E2479 TaxID=1834134 RepID=UPI0007FB836B|nr:hypothetical protein [Mycobacterium sp. E2479]OBH49281.1 hypothetical protein A5686_15495 [Mycobacterium sp. E2479]